MRNKALLVSVFTLAAFGAGHRGIERSVSASPATAGPTSSHLSLTKVDSEPAAGRKAPTPKALADMRKWNLVK